MKFFFIIRVFSIILFCCPALKADWTQTNGIYGGSIATIFSTTNKLFAATIYGSVYVSYDTGRTYIRRNSGLTDIAITSFTSIGNTVFAAGVENRGIFRTTNDGLNWVSVNTGITGKRVTCLASSGSNVFAGTGDSGMFVSSNFGANWIQINNGLTNKSVNSITITSNIVFIATSYFEIFQSSNNGLNWTSSFSGNNWYPFLTIASYDSTIVAGGIFTKIYRSTNLGQNWQQLSIDPGNVYSIAIRNSTICAGSADGRLFLSYDNGNAWSLNWLPLPCTISTVLIDGSNFFISLRIRDGINVFDGIYKSTDNGNNWFPYAGNIVASYIRTLFKNGERIYSGSNFEGIQYTTNSGTNWIEINNGLENLTKYIYSIGSCDSVLFAGIYSRLGRSTNYGGNWEVTSPPNNIPFFSFFSNDSIALALSDVPYKSTNLGIKWFQSNSGYVGGYEGVGFAETENYLFASSENALFRTTDLGDTWTKLLSHSGSYPITAITANGNNLFLGYANLDSGVYKSTDSGITFYFVNNGLTDRKIQSLYSVNNKVFAGTLRGGVFVTTNNGLNWVQINSGLGSLNISSIISDSTYLYAGTGGNGIWKIPLNEIITSENYAVTIPPKFLLSQNYPNPFNPTTNINFSISKNSFVTLKVYDVTGKEIESLVNEKLNAGVYSYDFNGEELASGIYFYKITAGDFSQVKKMTLLK